MTKKQFIAEAKRLGFNNYKELVEKVGYHARTLDRFKESDEISKKFEKSFEDYRNGATSAKKQDIGEIVVSAVKDETEAKKSVSQIKKIKDDGIGIDISNKDYHSSGKMSVSKLKVMIDNAKEFQSRYITKDFEQKETDALIVGRLHHTLVMEPHKINDEFIILDLPSRPVKEDYIKALEHLGGELSFRENAKQEMIVSDTIDTLKEKIDSIIEKTQKTICTRAHCELAQSTSEKALNSIFELVVGGRTLLKASLRDLLALPKAYVERTFYGVIDGVEVQIRPDILLNLGAKEDVWFVIDLKTLDVATPKEFTRQGGKFFWDMQEAFYMEVLKQNGINAKAFYFNCTGKKEFSGSQFYEWGISTKDEARKVLKAGFKKYKYCVENNIFIESKFDFKNLKFEAITTLDVPVYRQYTLGDLGV